MANAEALIVAIAVCAVAGLHVRLWADERGNAVARPLAEVVREAVRGSDQASRALMGGVLLALGFAALAPFLPVLGSVLGTILPV